ncbi:uncharacterized protein LOC100892379 [Strongylocentrotus purpuratus]|uniref:EF-hand domain-containing protein n=1 Tax=Strongylocentrotus purpuratus TaxID=7668 RepID=A0A7M7GM61_STRPU|nr:uncharacterized protein LOC100892379 [Strongylocentrotus purpuratus]|eukprot:XP_003728978.1 PREDICTED: uncharacterized protein LOC100892379 [Strongylocentrotus purpuratus]
MISLRMSALGFLNVRISLLCKLALVLPVVAAVLNEPGSLIEEAVTVTEEGLNLLPGESMSSRVKREYTNNRAARRRVFKQTDLNGDGLVTRKEYVIRNGNMTEEELDILFGAFDVDGDRSLSQDEFVRHGFLWVVAQECEFEAIRRCDDEFVYLIRAADPATVDNQQGMLCKAFQTYFDCIEHEQVSCDITSYSQAVIDLIATYRTVHFCPDLDFGGLMSMTDDGGDDDDDDDMVVDDGNDHTEMEPSELLSSVQDQETDEDGHEVVGNRPKRSPRSERRHHYGSRLPWWSRGLGSLFGMGKDDGSCSTSALKSCTESFNDELRSYETKADFCTSLSDYRHCVSRHARRCQEFELLEVENGLRQWLHLHHKLDLC